jgi:hypothetical protein
MLKLNKNTVNKVWVTFSELMQDTSNWVYLVFQNENNPNFRYHAVLKENISNLLLRTDTYLITLTDDDQEINPENAVINLPLAGFYEYTAFELDSSQDFDPTEPVIVKTLEKGRCQVEGDSPSVHTVYK